MKKTVFLLGLLSMLMLAGCATVGGANKNKLEIKPARGGRLYEGVIVNPTPYNVRILHVFSNVAIYLKPGGSKITTWPAGLAGATVTYYDSKGKAFKTVYEEHSLCPYQRHYWKGAFYWWKVVIELPLNYNNY